VKQRKRHRTYVKIDIKKSLHVCTIILSVTGKKALYINNNTTTTKKTTESSFVANAYNLA
jgi:hypothetical protein